MVIHWLNGNQTFIAAGKNGYLLEMSAKKDQQLLVDNLAQSIIQLFTVENLAQAHEASYEVARKYLTSEIEQKWVKLLGGIK